jgi:hypothetical protein
MSSIASRVPVRPAVLRLISQAECAQPGDPMSDEDYFLRQLRAAIAAGDSPTDRLRSRYGDIRNDRLCKLYARYAD